MAFADGQPFDGKPEKIAGGEFTFRSGDQFLKSVLWRYRIVCAERDAALAALNDARHQETARFRTLRRDVRSIKRALEKKGLSNDS